MSQIYYFQDLMVGNAGVHEAGRHVNGEPEPREPASPFKPAGYIVGNGDFFFRDTQDHLTGFYRYVAAGHIPITNTHEATSFFAWCIVLIFFLLQLRYGVNLLSSFIMPVAFALMLLSSMLPHDLLSNDQPDISSCCLYYRSSDR